MTGKEAARKALDAARKRGLSAEAYYSKNRQLDMRCFNGQVEHFQQAESGGLGIRVVRDGRAGMAYTEFLSPESVEETLDAAAAATEHLSSQEGVGLSDWPEAPGVAGIEAPEIEKLATEKKIALVLAAEKAAKAAGREIASVPWTGYGETAREVFLVNTEGLERVKKHGAAQLVVQALAARDNERKTFHDFCMTRRAAEFDAEKLGKKAGETAISLLGAEQPSSGKVTVLFNPRPFCSLLGIFSSQFSGKNAEEKRTPLAGRAGQKIGADAVSIIDDATREGGPASRPFDD
ncbi:MAG: TldD/PmbA family protein, partial [Planctomycetota bacterium]